jgi:uncharacterized protein YgiM (DUF1202 family)
MTNQTNSESNNSSRTSTIRIVVVGVIIIALLAVILMVLLGNQGDAPPDTGSGESPVIELPSQLPSGPTVTAIEAINVRSGTGTDYPIYGVAPAGSVGEVIGVSADGGWWVIKIPTAIAASGQGWVSAEFIRADNIGESPVIEAPPLP